MSSKHPAPLGIRTTGTALESRPGKKVSRWFPSVEWLEDRLRLTLALDYLAKDATPLPRVSIRNVLELVATGDPGTVLASKDSR